MINFGRMFMLLGALLLAVGALMTFGGRLPGLGNLPGDFHWQSGNFSFSFPVTSSIVVSLVLTVLANFFLR